MTRLGMLLRLVIFIFVCSNTSLVLAQDKAQKSELPRFAVISDTHFRNSNGESGDSYNNQPVPVSSKSFKIKNHANDK
jgi:hypothetical protein